MKNLIAVFALALAFSATAQRLEIEPVGDGKFVVTSVFEKATGETITRRSAPLDTVRAKREVSDFAASVSLRIAEIDLEKSRLLAEKSRAEEAFTAIDGATVEDEITEKLAYIFVGRYAFELRGEKFEMKIEKPQTESVSRLVASFEKGDETGTVKIEGNGAAIIFDLFRDGKGMVIDLEFTQIDGRVFVGEIDGEMIKFQKTSDKAEQ